MNTYGSIDECIGNTPLIQASRFYPPSKRNKLFFKCEFMNPGGSIKDRIGSYMIRKAEERGELLPGGTIVEATAGNTGMAIAAIAIRKGYKMVFIMTDKMSIEKRNLMEACGARIMVIPYGVSRDGASSFVEQARQVSKEIPGAYFIDQFSNPDNYMAHYLSTGPELWNETDGEISALVGGIGTGGTLKGVGKYLKEKKSDVRVVLADPAGSIFSQHLKKAPLDPQPYLVEGIGGDFIPRNADLSIIDEAFAISDRDSADALLHLYKTEGIFGGASSGCIAAAALRYMRCHADIGTVVAILPDSGRNYVSTFYNVEWKHKHNLKD